MRSFLSLHFVVLLVGLTGCSDTKRTTAPIAASSSNDSVSGVKQSEAAVLRKAAWANSGFDSAEATISTYFWSGREADLKRMQTCMSPDDGAAFERLIAKTSEPKMLECLTRAWNEADGYRIVSKESVAEDQIDFEIQVLGWGWDGGSQRLTLRRYGQVWKIDGLQRQAAEATAKAKQRAADVAEVLVESPKFLETRRVSPKMPEQPGTTGPN